MFRPWHLLSYTVLVLPPVLLTTYFLATFPSPRESVLLLPSLASLPPSCKSWDLYPENYFPGGDYVTFPNGKVRYWLFGPESGRKIVLIHGLSVPSMIWKNIAPELASKGYRVLLYDLYGRGYSDAPQTVYDAALYTTQLALLMQHIKWEKATIMGVSMGGAIAASFTASFPHLVDDRIILIAAAGLVEASDISRTAKFMSFPVVQVITSNAIVRKYLQHLADTETTAPIPDEKRDMYDLQEIVRLQSAHLPGYNAALSSSLRDGPIRGQAASFQSEAFKGKNVLIIHGTKDRTVPYKYASMIQGMLSNGTKSKLVTVQDGGHDLTVTDARRVLDEFEKFTQL